MSFVAGMEGTGIRATGGPFRSSRVLEYKCRYHEVYGVRYHSWLWGGIAGYLWRLVVSSGR